MLQTVRWGVFALFALLLLPLAACAKTAPQQAAGQDIPIVLDAAEPSPAQSIPMDAGGEAALEICTEAPKPDAETLRVLFINVGKADAILLQYGGRSALIDTGTEESAPRLLGALDYMGVDVLDILFLTHTHKDHIGGVPALGRNQTVLQAYAAQFSENKKNGGNKITEAASDAGIPLTRLSAGESVPFANGASFAVLGPLGYNGDDDNDNSLVLKLQINGRTLLLTGDMQFAEEATLLDAGADVSADVLKVGNHGNPDATSNAFGSAVSPSVAVISTDTAEDDDSANPRVYAALPGAAVYVTEDTALGVLLEITKDGTVTVLNAAPGRAAAQVTLTEPDRDTQTVMIQTGGERLDLSGWMLFSERGGELFRFPEGSAIAAGSSAVVAAEGGAGDFIFAGEDAPWHKKKADAAILYDRFGFVIAHS